MQFIIVNYVFLAFTDMCYSALNPLILSTPIQSGGLGLNPYQIGLIMGIWGFINAFVQIKLLGRIIRRYGAPSVYRVAYACQLVCFMSFPFSTYFARRDGSVGFGSCAVIFIQLSSQFIYYMAYGLYKYFVWKVLTNIYNERCDSCCCRSIGSKINNGIYQWSSADDRLHNANHCSSFCFFFVLDINGKTDSRWILHLCGHILHCPSRHWLQ